jgi:Cys-rich protein (TIGR01571 family)
LWCATFPVVFDVTVSLTDEACFFFFFLLDLLLLRRQGGPVMVVSGTREWEQGLCGCFSDCGGCIYATFCPACALASAKSNTDGSSWFLNCLLSWCCRCRISFLLFFAFSFFFVARLLDLFFFFSLELKRELGLHD